MNALLDDRRREPALRLTDEAWAITVVAALTESFAQSPSAPVRERSSPTSRASFTSIPIGTERGSAQIRWLVVSRARQRLGCECDEGGA